jgi:hypothetical protein
MRDFLGAGLHGRKEDGTGDLILCIEEKLLRGEGGVLITSFHLNNSGWSVLPVDHWVDVS